MNSLGARLAKARRNNGFTQYQVAQKLSIDTDFVSSWEQSKLDPDLKQLTELAKLYGVSADWLLSGKNADGIILEVTSNLSDRLFNENHMATYIGAYCSAKQFFQTKKALSYAKDKHRGQYRKPGHGTERIPYIYHPLLLTCHAISLGFDEDDILTTCLLHDVCEDCGVKVEELPASDVVKEAVRLLTKPKNFVKDLEHETEYYQAISENRIATIVKLLDRCNNISSMATSFSDKKIAGYIMETQEYVAPLIKIARYEYPEYTNQLFLIRYHMNSVLEALKHHMRSQLM